MPLKNHVTIAVLSEYAFGKTQVSVWSVSGAIVADSGCVVGCGAMVDKVNADDWNVSGVGHDPLWKLPVHLYSPA